MSIAFDRRCLTVLLTTPTADALSEVIGVACCGYPKSFSVFLKPSAVWPFKKSAAYSASNADATTEGMMVLMHYIAPFTVEMSFLFSLSAVPFWFRDKYNMPPARERALVSDKYDASEWTASCMLPA